MSRKRQKNQNQMELAFPDEPMGEAPGGEGEGAELLTAKQETENAARKYDVLEEILERDNLKEAYRRVKANRGSPGIDGMTVEELGEHLKSKMPEIREQMQSGIYRPQPVKRVEIPKPDGGGVRKLGIPTVLDRLIQQAVMQVLQRKWDCTFSERSYGFRPGRSQQQAVEAAKQHIVAGYTWCVDLDLEKFFDRVNHDKLMGRIAQRVEDKRVLKLIRAFLRAGVMEDGLVSPSEEGTPQGGPLSPLLSNLVLDELDRELEARGHRFVRYADDCNIYVRSERAGQRVMESVKRFISKKLKLKVNEAQSAVAKPQERKFLGFSFTKWGELKRLIAPKAIARFKERVREITRRNRGISMKERIKELAVYMRGWLGYYGFSEVPSQMKELNSWVRRRIRCVFWWQWKTARKRRAELINRGVKPDLAASTAGSRKGPWRVSQSPALTIALPNDYLHSLGLPKLVVQKA
ncbi:MAG: group II intron reverse transcriptase/maturase [Acidobacteria bacterium]|nr:group II intron reverse transcriptase/maturase [Acidobacteriota bacterium]